MKHIKKKEFIVTALAVIILLSVAVIDIMMNKSTENAPSEDIKEEAYQSLSDSDKELADLYAELYEMTAEDVARIQTSTGDWEETGKELEKQFFTIPENTKYQMTKDGYSIDDLQEAEKLSAKTGRKAMELAKAKGKASENRNWSDVVSDSEILSSEEQLGLTKDQINQLKNRSLNKEDRMNAAILLLNGTYTFAEILQGLDAGKTIEELKQSVD